jgi:hypothetical protein
MPQFLGIQLTGQQQDIAGWIVEQPSGRTRVIKFKIIGLYRIAPTKKSITQAARYHDYGWLIDDYGEYVEEIYWDNHEDLGLLEAQIRGAFAPRELLALIAQDDQAPYMEFYLDSTGSRLLSPAEAIETEDRRVCFFLHFIDLAKPLRVGKEEIGLPPWSPLPKRLQPFAHYLPVG